MDQLVGHVPRPPPHALIFLQEKAVVEEWFSGCEDTGVLLWPVLLTRDADRTEEVRRLAMGRLLAETSAKMNQTVARDDKNPPKILIYCTHDSVIAGILGTLEVFDDQ